ncbi:hypothetical protein PIB30_000854 [Stylosanthes scabra]|uniref:Laccase n=1 Tax=Stylosanthes scabra TaxID=79078 RepID=A0ABU6R3Q3_9FABA|nr:hypothetical protein [Stylosanthes scabra]
MRIARVLQFLGILFLNVLLTSQALRHHKFVVRDAPFTRLCSTKNILTVNGQFPGPTLYVTKGETIIVDVYNRANYNITIHWHGVNQPRYPWSDGPEYITQCPIQPGGTFTQKVIFSEEEGTLWWHAHSDWSRATVHGAIVVKPAAGNTYPFPKPDREVPIILGEWWKQDVVKVFDDLVTTGGDAAISDSYLINGQPGDLHPCSSNDTFKLKVEHGNTYLLRMINAAMQDLLFFAIANHQLTIVGTDGSYVKPFTVEYITISPGQTMDVLLHANQPLDRYYMAAKAYSSALRVVFDNTTTTAIVEYKGKHIPSYSWTPHMPSLPSFNDINSSVNIISQMRSLADEPHPINVPMNITTNLFYTVSINSLPCPNGSICKGPRGNLFAASMNNISFQLPSKNNVNSILQAYYNNISGVFTENFPDVPPQLFDFTGSNLSTFLRTPSVDTEVKLLEYGSTVELVIQGTNLLAGTEHPMHLHGHSFYVVGWGFGNYNKEKDPLKYNLVDPPYQNTVAVPKNGWVAIRFQTKNPGVWFMHCHLERHASWGMAMTFIVKNGNNPQQQMLPPPPDMPRCY